MWALKEVLSLKYNPTYHICEDSSLNCCYTSFSKNKQPTFPDCLQRDKAHEVPSPSASPNCVHTVRPRKPYHSPHTQTSCRRAFAVLSK